jgi:SAM-dependent MidA family methyltransferase
MAEPAGPRLLPWGAAMRDALYGPAGFYHRRGGPSAHFRTAVHAGPRYAEAVRRLARLVDEALGRPDPFLVVDLGAGRGELGARLAEGAPPRWRVQCVELAARPAGLPAGVGWSAGLPERVTGLVVANEWLDNQPLDVVIADEGGAWRVLDVDPRTGEEHAGSPAGEPAAAWLRAWGPPAQPGFRAEIGLSRDRAWSAVVRRLDRGVALAVDYGYAGRSERPCFGTLTGYRGGHQVLPVPDGSCDLTAHVAFDAVAAAGLSAGAQQSVLTSQREALLRLEPRLGPAASPPAYRLAAADPPAYLAALRESTEAAELLDPAGLGGFYWLGQSVGCANPLA